MLHLIGGTGRTGKSTLAKRVVPKKPMLWTSTDLVQWLLHQNAPQLGVQTGLAGDVQEAAFRPYLETLCSGQEYHEADSLIEGHVIHPRFVRSLLDKGTEARACFLGWLSIDRDVLLANQGRNTWLLCLEEAEQSEVIDEIVPASIQLQAECEEFGLPFVDMGAASFESQLEVATDILLGR